MKKSYESGLATHIGPESCGAARKGGVEALTGERAGRVFSRVRNSLRDADVVRSALSWLTGICTLCSTCGSRKRCDDGSSRRFIWCGSLTFLLCVSYLIGNWIS